MSIPEPSVLLESPLDAPPIVLFQAPKPPPSDETWAQLRTDLTPKRDVLMEEVHAERRSRSRGVYVFMALAVLALGVVAFRALAPTLWYRWVPGAREERVISPPPSTVSISDPVRFVPVVDASAPVDVGPSPVDVGPSIVAPVSDAHVFTDATAAAPTVDAPAAPSQDAATVSADAPAAPDAAARRRRRHR